MKNPLLFLATFSFSSVLAGTVLDVDFEHWSARRGEQLTVNDGEAVQDLSGANFHGFLAGGSSANNTPLVEGANAGTAVDTRSTNAYFILRPNRLIDEQEWVPAFTGNTPETYLTLQQERSYTFEAVLNWQGNLNRLDGIMGFTGGAEWWIREQSGIIQYVFDDGSNRIEGSSAANSIANWIDNSDWHHVAIVLDKTAAEIRIYLDYQLIDTLSSASISQLGQIGNGSEDLRLGAYNSDASSRFDGWQDRYRISDNVLSPAEFIEVNVPAPPTEPEPPILGPFPESIPFTSGVGYPVYRIPAIVRSNDNTLLAFAEGRASISDGGNIDIVLRRSSDGGETWGPLILVQEEGGTAPITIGNPAPVVDRESGDIHLLFTRENDTVFHTKSSDDGLTWSERVEITANVKFPEWGWYATGPCHGIQLTRGAQAGRLVVPANHRIGNDGSDSGSFGAQVLYSDDRGVTWQMTATADGANGTGPNETTLVELVVPDAAGSHIYINSRDYGSDPGNRSEAFSADGGASYSVPYDGNPHFVTPIVQASLLRFSSTDEGDDQDRIIFSCPNGGSRQNGAIWVSRDEAGSWSDPKPLFASSPRDFAYSDLVKTPVGELGILYETDNYNTIRFARVDSEWIDLPPPPVTDPQAVLWQFNEGAPNDSVSTGVDALLDTHPNATNQHLTTTSTSLRYSAGPQADSVALSLDGSSGLFRDDAASKQAFDFGPDDSVTIEARFLTPPSAPLFGAIVAKNQQPGGEWWIRVQGDGRLAFLWDDGADELLITSQSVVNDAQWHHLAAVRDAGARELRLYLDGVLESSLEDTTTNDVANSQALNIGQFNGTDGRNFQGEIDWIAFSTEALGPGEWVYDRLVVDADIDGIPDEIEIAITGNLATLGQQDTDGDGILDWLEVAVFSDPMKADGLGSVKATTGGLNLFSYRKRDKMPWLTLDERFSFDLVNWSGQPEGLDRVPQSLGDGSTEVNFRANGSPIALPLFFQVRGQQAFP